MDITSKRLLTPSFLYMCEMCVRTVCFAIKDIAGDAADPVQLTATAVELIGNLVYAHSTYNTLQHFILSGGKTVAR